MYYYNSKGELVNYNLDKPQYNGTTAEIYIENDTVLKKYYPSTSNDRRIDYDLFNFIKKLNNSYTYKLLNIYYNNRESALVDAYEYKFIKQEPVDIFSKDVEYLIYNLEALANLMNILVENNIVVSDLITKNIVFNNDKIILIDLDAYEFDFGTTSKALYKNNMFKLKLVFMNLFMEQRQNLTLGETITLFGNNSIEYFNIKDISKKLKKYKTVNDYFRDC